MLDWESLKHDCLSCTACQLCETRTNVVFGVGSQSAEVLFIGEGPGEQEDLQGEPFVGRAGKLLDDMLAMIDLDRSKIYILPTQLSAVRPRTVILSPKSRQPALSGSPHSWNCSSPKSSSALAEYLPCASSKAISA